MTRPTRRRYSEHVEQRALIKWVRTHERIEPRLKLLFAIPNGERREPRVAARLRREGVVPGVPDLCLPIPLLWNNGMPAVLFIEMKSAGGRQSIAQQNWAHAAETSGCVVVVLCRTWIEAANVLCTWLGNPKLRSPA